MIEKQIDLIQKQIEKLTSSDFDLSAWKSSSILILDRIFGNDFQGIKAIEKINYKSGGLSMGNHSSSWNNMDSCKKQGKEILLTCITELETFGEREKPQNNNSGININLTQNQSVNISLLVSALEDELTVSQMREVNEIMQSTEDSQNKKVKILDKIKNFGSDVASNILANILTNPAIWG
jgi:hypothetical protein